MREIVLDTETTGLDPNAGHRVVEIGAIELINHVATDQHRQYYLNPEREMPEEAFRIHGLSDAFLSDKPRFVEVADDFLDFIGESALVIHNASFDIGFLNAELERIGRPALAPAAVVDTVQLARQRFPGAQASLDALCRRFEIDNSARELHGALLDCELLAEVYLELRGGRQPGLELNAARQRAQARLASEPRVAREPRPHQASDEELAAHAAMLERLAEPLWKS